MARVRTGYKVAAEFAEHIGVKPYQLSNWETGRSEVDDEDARRIAEGLGMDLIEVRRNLGLWVPDANSPKSDTAADIAEVLTRLTELSAELQELAHCLANYEQRTQQR